jgi:hypothetical protein
LSEGAVVAGVVVVPAVVVAGDVVFVAVVVAVGEEHDTASSNITPTRLKNTDKVLFLNFASIKMWPPITFNTSYLMSILIPPACPPVPKWQRENWMSRWRTRATVA